MRISKVLFPSDYSAASLAGAKTACKLANKYKAVLHVLHVIGPQSLYGGYGHASYPVKGLQEALESGAKFKMSRFVMKLGRIPKNKVRTSVLIGFPAEAICQYAKKHRIDLIMIPTHGRKGVPRFFLGSVTERVVRMAPCPVLTIRTSKP